MGRSLYMVMVMVMGWDGASEIQNSAQERMHSRSV